MKLALFGGTFDPVHHGHLAVAHAAARQFDLTWVYFVPADLPPHKENRALTDFHHRFAMVALATAEDDRFLPSLMEADSSEPNYSIQTVRRMKQKMKKSDKLYFLIGIDAFMDIATWKEPEELLGECDFIVASRPGYSLADLEKALPERLRPTAPVLQALRKQQASGTIALSSTTIHLLTGVGERVSSTQIRAAAKRSIKQLSRFVPEPVARYIKKEHLYVGEERRQEKAATGDNKVLSFGQVHRQKS